MEEVIRRSLLDLSKYRFARMMGIDTRMEWDSREQGGSGDVVRTLLKEVCLRGSPYFPSDFGLNYVSNLTYIWLSTLRIKMVSSTVYRMVNMNIFLSFIPNSLVSLKRILLTVILVLKTIHIFIILHDPPPHTHTIKQTKCFIWC